MFSSSNKAFSKGEIQQRVQQGYIDRLATRLRKMRKQLMDRDWQALQTETHHLIESSENFGFEDLAIEGKRTLSLLSQKELSRSRIDPEAKLALENLFKVLDQFLAQRPNSH